MDQGPLVMEEIDAGAELVRAFDKYAPVEVAFWLKASDEEQRYLYIASDQIKDTNLGAAYGEVLRLAQRLSSPYLDPFRVKLISAANPLAQAATEIHRRFPGRLATRFGGRLWGRVSVDDVYIYPSPLPATVP
ncbi:MAG: hypothetical protein JNM56_40200 [Planctomycetia bacterium]|nr:hypothetical protein [Planctomycetia bacterium]